MNLFPINYILFIFYNLKLLLNCNMILTEFHIYNIHVYKYKLNIYNRPPKVCATVNDQFVICTLIRTCVTCMLSISFTLNLMAS